MDTLLKNKNINSAFGAVSLLLLILSVFFIIKIINEIKSSRNVSSFNNIYIEGKGEVKTIPDIATLSINVSKEGVTAKEAQNLLNESVTKAVEYFKTQQIEDKDIKSEYGGLNPKYSYEKEVCYTYPCPVKEPKIIGYTATQSISVRIREVDNANILRTGLADLGITNISGPTFSIDDEDIYKEKAQALAIADAKEKAEILAKELGVKLGDIISFSEGVEDDCFGGCGYESMMMDSAAKSVSAPAPTLPKGENTITSKVTITYEIK